jgi:bacteriocin biosynthesis cyclodehydratase domain-containing protein
MIPDAPPEALALVNALDGAQSRATIEARFAQAGGAIDPAEAIEQLWDLGLLEDAAASAVEPLPSAARDRYDRQLAYFAGLCPPGVHRDALQARLARSRVCVLGLGGLGCWTVSALAAVGVGQITVVDGDVVEQSNLNRQILYTPADVGQSKALAGARTLRSFNPLIEVEPVVRLLESEREVEEVASGADAILELADWPVGKLTAWVAAVSCRLGIPHVQGSNDPPLLRVGPTFIPGVTGCAECQVANDRSRYELYDELRDARAARSEETPTYAPVCAVIGGVLANEVVELLLGLTAPATAGRAAILDLRSLTWRWDGRVEPRSDCSCCHCRQPDAAVGTSTPSTAAI